MSDVAWNGLFTLLGIAVAGYFQMRLSEIKSLAVSTKETGEKNADALNHTTEAMLATIAKLERAEADRTGHPSNLSAAESAEEALRLHRQITMAAADTAAMAKAKAQGMKR